MIKLHSTIIQHKQNIVSSFIFSGLWNSPSRFVSVQLSVCLSDRTEILTPKQMLLIFTHDKEK